MRTISLFLFVALTLTAAALAQTKIPPDVEKAFTTKFPSVTDVKWDNENDREFEAEFKMTDREMSAVFSAGGAWVETETELPVDRLPAAVSQSLAKEFKGFTVKEAASVEKPEKELCYEVEISKGERTMEVLFSRNGKVVEKKDADDDDEGSEDDD